MRCYICDHSETAPNNYDITDKGEEVINQVFIDPDTGLPICEGCYEEVKRTVLDYEEEDD